jgi:hypothetical protein
MFIKIHRFNESENDINKDNIKNKLGRFSDNNIFRI